MDARAFLDTSSLLSDPLNPDLREPDFRTAISRAYYASFLDARELLDTMGFGISRQADTHKIVRLCFAHAQPTSFGRRVSEMLKALHDKRKDADYTLSISPAFNQKDAEDATNDAEDIIALLDNCRSTTTLYTNVETSIRNWLSSLSSP
jgi:uncharacterized protein (UPF0332 family)